MRRRLWAATALVMVLMLGAACSGNDSEAGSAAGMDAPAQEGGGGGGGSDGSARRSLGVASRDSLGDSATSYDAGDAYEVGADVPVAVQAEMPLTPERVIKTADLRLEVEDGTIGRTLRAGREIAEAAGGFLLSTSIDGTDRRSGEFTIRVPAERFEETLSALEDLGDITGEDVRGEDVSQEFVDLEARLRNATAQEEVLFRLYDRSQSIADTIRVQRELEDVQLEIERLRGRLRFLEDRTDLSTISVSVRESGAVVAEPGPFEKAWDNARDTFVGVVSGVIVGAGFVLPLLVLALVAYAVFRIVRPRLGKPAATPAE
ncbi:MAG TPA: DUF4349 domain-containing protein [Actinomycetota bacterium]|nr:DUF4349 domain-containing protein [Actinomycetota bacterium]